MDIEENRFISIQTSLNHDYTFKIVWDRRIALKNLTIISNVNLPWILEHKSITGNNDASRRNIRRVGR